MLRCFPWSDGCQSLFGPLMGECFQSQKSNCLSFDAYESYNSNEVSNFEHPNLYYGSVMQNLDYHSSYSLLSTDPLSPLFNHFPTLQSLACSLHTSQSLASPFTNPLHLAPCFSLRQLLTPWVPWFPPSHPLSPLVPLSPPPKPLASPPVNHNRES